MSDPRRPAVPIELEPDEKHVLVDQNGVLKEHFNMIYSEEDAERIRAGYCCIHCGESQVDKGTCPFPENCWLCKFPMRDKQLERYETEWVGHVRLGPSSNLEEELAALEEIDARRKRVSSIAVPRAL